MSTITTLVENEFNVPITSLNDLVSTVTNPKDLLSTVRDIIIGPGQGWCWALRDLSDNISDCVLKGCARA